MTRDDKTSSNATAAADKPAIWVGIIPDIFGYGLSVMAESQEACDKALRAEYRRWKKDTAKFMRSNHQPYNPADTTYDESFENFGGRIFQIAQGKVYFSNFGS